MNTQLLQGQSSEESRHAENMLKERLASITQPNAYDFRMLASFYLNSRRYEEANAVLFQMLQLASEEDNLELLQALYQDLGWTALLSRDPERARRHFSCQRAMLEELRHKSENETSAVEELCGIDESVSESIFRESDVNLFVVTHQMGLWGTARRHLLRLQLSFDGKTFGFDEFVAGRQESLQTELPDFVLCRTMVFLETLEQAESEQPLDQTSTTVNSLN
jgi:hypothetical protein